MADEKRTDPFKPTEPAIPGIPVGSGKNAPADPTPLPPTLPPFSRRIFGIVAAIVVAGIVGVVFFFWQRGSSSQADRATAEPAATPAAEPSKPAPNLPIGPGPVASKEELAKPWASKRFLFRDPVTSEPVPAMIVHLPDGSYWAFSLREPFGTCDLDYVTSLEKLRTDYRFTASHPMVVNTCDRTVYDLLLYGGSSDGGLVRGEVVAGSGIRPPMAIEVRVDGKQLVTARME